MIVSFPYYYLALEKIRQVVPGRNLPLVVRSLIMVGVLAAIGGALFGIIRLLT